MAGKQPKLILRESAIDDVIRDWPPGRFLEMGAGTGYMTRFLLERGHTGAASDLGDSSRAMMRRNLAFAGDQIRVFDSVAELSPASFDYLAAFEVLEHIEQDLAVLTEWVTYLRPGGRAVFSVPAHQRKFGRSDSLVGHMRRYEKKALRELLERAGFEQIRIINYGFPVTELTRRISNRIVAQDASYDGMNAQERSIRSAQAQPKRIARVLSWVDGRLFRPFCTVQRWFYGLDWGDGYVASAVKSDVRVTAWRSDGCHVPVQVTRNDRRRPASQVFVPADDGPSLIMVIRRRRAARPRTVKPRGPSSGALAVQHAWPRIALSPLPAPAIVARLLRPGLSRHVD